TRGQRAAEAAQRSAANPLDKLSLFRICTAAHRSYIRNIDNLRYRTDQSLDRTGRYISSRASSGSVVNPDCTLAGRQHSATDTIAESQLTAHRFERINPVICAASHKRVHLMPTYIQLPTALVKLIRTFGAQTFKIVGRDSPFFVD